MDRKGMKANARKAYKRHYWMIVVICLFASVFGVAVAVPIVVSLAVYLFVWLFVQQKYR